MASLRLVTFLPQRPDRSIPRLRSRIRLVGLRGTDKASVNMGNMV